MTSTVTRLMDVGGFVTRAVTEFFNDSNRRERNAEDLLRQSIAARLNQQDCSREAFKRFLETAANNNWSLAQHATK